MDPLQRALSWLAQGTTRTAGAASGPLTFARALTLQRQFLARQGFILPPTLEERVAQLLASQ